MKYLLSMLIFAFKVIDERANMNIIPQLEKKKKFTDAELDNKILLIKVDHCFTFHEYVNIFKICKQKIEVFISDLLKAKVFPIELLQFLCNKDSLN